MKQVYAALRIYQTTWYALSQIKTVTREPFVQIVDRLVEAERQRIKAAQQQKGNNE